MKFINQKVHGTLDYSVALTLIGGPILLGFAAVSMPAAVVAIAAGAGLALYSLVTDYSGGVRGLISFRLHLVIDAIAATALLVTPFLFGFDGVARAFYLAVGAAVLVVVAFTRLEPGTVRESVQRADPGRAAA